MCILFLPCRSVEDGDLWSLTLENYVHSKKLKANHSATVRNLYGSADRLIILLSVQFQMLLMPNSKLVWCLCYHYVAY